MPAEQSGGAPVSPEAGKSRDSAATYDIVSAMSRDVQGIREDVKWLRDRMINVVGLEGDNGRLGSAEVDIKTLKQQMEDTNKIRWQAWGVGIVLLGLVQAAVAYAIKHL
jgi:hypothetical protein